VSEALREFGGVDILVNNAGRLQACAVCTAGLEPQLGPLSAGYVLFLAVLGPVLVRAGK
jgi:NAD(P)-dependent dehydrogenase (short-subunit alcohol dehydrogenase family)